MLTSSSLTVRILPKLVRNWHKILEISSLKVWSWFLSLVSHWNTGRVVCLFGRGFHKDIHYQLIVNQGGLINFPPQLFINIPNHLHNQPLYPMLWGWGGSNPTRRGSKNASRVKQKHEGGWCL